MLLGENGVQLLGGFLLKLFQLLLLFIAQFQLLHQGPGKQLAGLGHHEAASKPTRAPRTSGAPAPRSAGTAKSSGSARATGTTPALAATATPFTAAFTATLTAALAAALATPATATTLQGFHLGNQLLHFLLGDFAVLVGVQALEKAQHPLVVLHLVLGDLAILVGIQFLQPLHHLPGIDPRGAGSSRAAAPTLRWLGHQQARHQSHSGSQPQTFHSCTHRAPP